MKLPCFNKPLFNSLVMIVLLLGAVCSVSAQTLIESATLKGKTEQYEVKSYESNYFKSTSYANVKNVFTRTPQTFPDISDLPPDIARRNDLFVGYEQDYIKINYPEVIKRIAGALSVEKLKELFGARILLQAYIHPSTGVVKEFLFVVETRASTPGKKRLTPAEIESVEKSLLNPPLLAYVSKRIGSSGYLLKRKGWNYYRRDQGLNFRDILNYKLTGNILKKYTSSFGLDAYMTMEHFLK